MAAEKLEDMVPLPVDVNGEVFHIGDEIVDSMGKRGVVDFIEIRFAEKETCHYVSFTGSALRYVPRELRHYHKPTVEDVLREFGTKYIQVVETPEPIVGFGNEIIGEEDPKEVIAEYAAKLRLKEEE